MLITDDGTFLIGNTFVDLFTADEYHELRQTEAWIDEEVTDTQKEAALVRSFDYLKVQDWADGVFDYEIPVRVIEAQCVAAGKELDNPGQLQADQKTNVKRERIEGAIDTEYFSKNLSSETIHTEIQNLIKPYLTAYQASSTSTQKFLVRM